MIWFPFDTQVCRLKMVFDEERIVLVPTSVSYSGPKDLISHKVQMINMNSSYSNKGSGIVVNVVLVRPLLGTLLTVYLPTSMLLLLCQMVNIFSTFYMEMVIEVNLTLLLVLATMLVTFILTSL